MFLLLIPTWALRRSTDLKDYLAATSATLFGILYIGLSLSCLVPIRFARSIRSAGTGSSRQHDLIPEIGPQPILLLFLVIWAGDICAYLVGRPVWPHTVFCPHLSPQDLGGRAGGLGRKPPGRLGLCTIGSGRLPT